MVKNPYEIEVVFPSVMLSEPPHRYEEGYGASVACESAFPRHEYFPECLPAAEIIVRLVEKAMSETGADDCTYQEGIKEGVKQGFRHSFPSEETSEDEPSEYESRDEKQ